MTDPDDPDDFDLTVLDESTRKEAAEHLGDYATVDDYFREQLEVHAVQIETCRRPLRLPVMAQPRLASPSSCSRSGFAKSQRRLLLGGLL